MTQKQEVERELRFVTCCELIVGILLVLAIIWLHLKYGGANG